MNAALGILGVTLGALVSICGAAVLVVGVRTGRPELLRTGRQWAVLVMVAAVIAVVAMERALITRDFSLQFVAKVGSTRTPALFNVAALWSALEGSILLWTLILAGYLLVVAHHFRARLADPLVAWALITMLCVSAFFFLMMALARRTRSRRCRAPSPPTGRAPTRCCRTTS